jgi:hypothetical protein
VGTTELALPKIVEILGPDGEYEKRRIALRNEYSAVVEQAKTIIAIDSAEAAEEATKLGRLLQVASKETETFFKGVKVQVDAIKAPILAAEKADCGPYESEKKRIGTLQSAWDQKVIREKEETDRLAREKAIQDAREEALLRAIEMESLEGTEAAEAILQEPIVAAPVVTLSKSAGRPTGSVNRGTVYKGRVENLMELVKAIAVGKAPLNAVMANESFINNQADQYKDAFSMPGVKLDKSIPPTSYRR